MKTLIFVVIFGLSASLALEKNTCTEQTECNCGEVCVYKRQGPCMPGQSGCKCVRGCVLGEKFFKPRESRSEYCNECFCKTDSKRGSWLGCTRKAWCNLPMDVPLYHPKPDCPDDDIMPLR